MKRLNWMRAIKAWTKVVGSYYIMTDRESLAAYESSIRGLKHKIPVVLRPASTEEVQAIVRVAGRFKTPVCPISTAVNHGFGSGLTVCDDCAIVDLGRMNRILEVNVEQQYAVIEPGVTQKQLYEYMQEHDIPLLPNVTVATDAGIIGDAQECGIGCFESRAEFLSGMEVVLGTGEVIRTGFGDLDSSRSSYVYRHGVDSALESLFAQSNFGIVTSAGIDLMPKPEAQSVFVMRIDEDEKIGDAIESLAGLLRDGIVGPMIHVGNSVRAGFAMSPFICDSLIKNGMSKEDAFEMSEGYLQEEGFGQWSVVAGLVGSRRRTALAKREIRAAMRGVGSVMFLSEFMIMFSRIVLTPLKFIPSMRRKIYVLGALEAQHDFSKCVPSAVSMQSAYRLPDDYTHNQRHGADNINRAILYVVPFSPPRRDNVAEMVKSANEICGEFGFEPCITLNAVNCRRVEAVISIAFDRDDAEQSERAQACVERMLERYLKAGMIPYRGGGRDLPQLVKESDKFRCAVKDLKTAVDPRHIISP